MDSKPLAEYTPREVHLAIIDRLESGVFIEKEELASAYISLATAWAKEGNVTEEATANNDAKTIATSTDEERQQFYIDKMEECDDIDLDALAEMYDTLHDLCNKSGKLNTAKEARENAQTLRSLCITSGSSRRATPRSEISFDEVTAGYRARKHSHESVGGSLDKHNDNDNDNDMNSVHSGLSINDNEEVDNMNISSPKEKEKEKIVKWITHDSISSPIVTHRPLSRDSYSNSSSNSRPTTDNDTGTGTGTGTNSDAKIIESKEENMLTSTISDMDEEGKDTDRNRNIGGTYDSKITNNTTIHSHSHSHIHIHNRPNASSEAKVDDIRNAIKILRYEDDAKDYATPAEKQKKEEIEAKDTKDGKFDAKSVNLEDDDNDYYDEDFDDDGKNNSSNKKYGLVESSIATNTNTNASQAEFLTKTKKPMLFLTWDGEEDSWENVNKLMKFLRAKGYVVFEHAGDDCTGSSQKIPGFSASKLLGSTTGSIDGSVSIVNTGPNPTGSITSESIATADTSTPISAGQSARAKVSQAIVDKMSVSTVFVACVTRKFTKNLNCKKIVLRMREIQIEKGKKSAEMLYTMVHGTFTTESQPYHCRDGWLGYLLRDSLWSPAWSHAHIQGAAEAIAATVSLRRSIITLHPSHILYIESRGRQGVCPPCFTKPR